MTLIASRSRRRLLIAALIVISQLAYAEVSRASKAGPISASYDVLQRTSIAGREQIQVRIRLVNQGANSVQIKRMAVWTSALPERGATRTCSLFLAPRGSATIEQEFTVRSADYDRWRTGSPPRLILQFASAGKTTSKQVVRLEPRAQRISAQEEK